MSTQGWKDGNVSCNIAYDYIYTYMQSTQPLTYLLQYQPLLPLPVTTQGCVGLPVVLDQKPSPPPLPSSTYIPQCALVVYRVRLGVLVIFIIFILILY